MAHPVVDTKLDDTGPEEILFSKHIRFLVAFTKQKDPTIDYMRMSGIFWTLTALDLMGQLDQVNKDEVIEYVISCHKPDGGYSPAPLHDSHLVSTLHAVEVLALFDALDKINVDIITDFVKGLQQPDGSFTGDRWGEVDTRFTFCALAILRLAGKLNDCGECKFINVASCISYLERCQNPDGGFGRRPGSESHAGQAFCVVGSMAMLHQVRRLNCEKAAWWLADRQLPSGGINGRPEKQPDVCYSWWALSTLTILGRLVWVDNLALTHFILASQDIETGGIADRPGNYPDPFHTLFGLAGLSLLSNYGPKLSSEYSDFTDDVDDDSVFMATGGGEEEEKYRAYCLQVLLSLGERLKRVNPVFCLPQDTIDRLNIKVQLLI